MNLKDKKCSPTKGPAIPLDLEHKKIYLNLLNHDWKLVDSCTRLCRSYKFKNFKRTLGFVNTISEISETENHHPEITFGWGYCNLKIWTHTNNDLHENDFILAAKIDEAFNLLNGKDS